MGLREDCDLKSTSETSMRRPENCSDSSSPQFQPRLDHQSIAHLIPCTILGPWDHATVDRCAGDSIDDNEISL